MIEPMTESELCAAAWTLLKERFGPVNAMRFLSLMRAPTRDYQAWRDERFGELGVDELIAGLRETEAEQAR